MKVHFTLTDLSLHQTATYLVEQAIVLNHAVSCDFRNVKLIVNPGQTVSDTLYQYDLEVLNKFQRAQSELRSAELPPFSVQSEKAWKNLREQAKTPQDFLNLRAASMWAYLMEEKMKTGATLEEASLRTFDQATCFDLNPSQLHHLIELLYFAWTHGQELHNVYYR